MSSRHLSQASSRRRTALDLEGAAAASRPISDVQQIDRASQKRTRAVGPQIPTVEDWDLAAVSLRHVERRLLSETDVQLSPDRHLGTSEAGPIAERQLPTPHERQPD